MKPITKELTFDEWNGLSFESKREIWNHHWTPHEPEIGKNTKQSIVERFANELKVDFEQVGIGAFGWTVYMLFVIVKDSKTNIPKRFSDLPVNKGLIIERLKANLANVKFDYGGTTQIDLTDNMIIK